MQRIIPLKKIPQSLWNGGIIYFSAVLRNIYDDTLSQYSLIEKAKVFVSGVVGGPSANEADQHFAQRYLTSASRVEFAYLDPMNLWVDIHNILNEILSEGRIGLLDLACGSGAATLGLVSTLIELREKRILPQLPLSIHIIGADYSARSLEIFKKQLEPLLNVGKRYGIDITSELLICDLQSATDINDVLRKFTSGEFDDYLVVIANISSALETEVFRESLTQAMTLLLGYLNGKSTNIISIEPSKSRSEEKRWFKKIVERALKFFGDWATTPAMASTAQYQFSHYLLNKNVSSNVAIKEVRHGE